ncbi:CpaD family pilus assembly protein [Breoghania sp. L-A4]|uniref:CpaD family pilus assembly protein n=1 Tax=Breoghania sp. L-A4 TaxID=2304600 RepID=UPI0013C32481|nr:CpaD family pilus assembly protein [Breoghania sp. L-A4]
MTDRRNGVGARLRTRDGLAGGPLRALFVAGGLAAALAGCQSVPTAENVARHDYKLRHPIVISEAAETFDIPVGAETRSLSRQMRESVEGFAREARQEGSGDAEILVPSGSRNEAGAHSIAGEVRRVLLRAGFAGHRVHIRSYPVGDPRVVAPLRIAYSRVKASVHACGRWTDNLASNGANEDYADFGCATQSNLAAMIDNPADLLHPRAEGPADRSRRDTVQGKYREGVSPSGKYAEGVGAKVSDVGN